MHTSVTLFGMLLKVVGTLIGVCGVAGVSLALIGSQPDAFWPGVAALAVGTLIGFGGLLLAGWGLNRMGDIGKRLMFAGFAIPAGAFLAWLGLGANGVLTVLHLDPTHFFDLVTSHPIFWLMAACGIGLVFYGFGFLFASRERVAAVRVG